MIRWYHASARGFRLGTRSGTGSRSNGGHDCASRSLTGSWRSATGTRNGTRRTTCGHPGDRASIHVPLTWVGHGDRSCLTGRRHAWRASLTVAGFVMRPERFYPNSRGKRRSSVGSAQEGSASGRGRTRRGASKIKVSHPLPTPRSSCRSGGPAGCEETPSPWVPWRDLVRPGVSVDCPEYLGDRLTAPSRRPTSRSVPRRMKVLAFVRLGD